MIARRKGTASAFACLMSIFVTFDDRRKATLVFITSFRTDSRAPPTSGTKSLSTLFSRQLQSKPIGKASSEPSRGLRCWFSVRSTIAFPVSNHAPESPTLAPTTRPSEISTTTAVHCPPVRTTAWSASYRHLAQSSAVPVPPVRNLCAAIEHAIAAAAAPPPVPPAPSATIARVRDPECSTRTRSSPRPPFSTLCATVSMAGHIIEKATPIEVTTRLAFLSTIRPAGLVALHVKPDKMPELRGETLCAVQRHGLFVGANPTRQLSLQPVATGAVVEVTKQLKPSV